MATAPTTAAATATALATAMTTATGLADHFLQCLVGFRRGF